MRGMIEAYHEANPLSAESFDVLLIDMALPNEFYKHLKEVFFDPVTFLSTGGVEAIQQRIVAADQSKWQALAELAKDKSKYKAERYEQLAALRQPRRPVRESVPDADKWVLQKPAQADAQPESAKKGKRHTAAVPEPFAQGKRRTAEQREPAAQEKRREDAQRESAVQEKRRTAEEPAAVTKKKERVGASPSEAEAKKTAVSKRPVVRNKARVKLKAAGAKGVYRKLVRKVKREESRLQKRRPSVKTATSVSRRKPETSRSTTKRKPVQTSRSTTKRKPVQTSRPTTKRKPTQPAPPAAKRRPKQKSKTGVIKLKKLIKRAASTVQRKRKVQKPSALTRRADKDKKQAVKNRKRLFGQTAAT
jgi:hypothetical protein